MAANTPQPTSDAKGQKGNDNGPASSNDSSVKYDKRKVLDQYLKEKLAAMRVRQVKINNWIRNEELYNGVTQKTLLTRSNLHVPKVFEGVHTMASRIGVAPECAYVTKPEGDDNAAEIMKHLFFEDAKACGWDLTYDNSKVEAGIYGRGIFKLIPSNSGNRWELVDTLSYLVSPIAKNCRDALYQGQQFIYKTMAEIEEDAVEFEYDMEEVNRLKTQKVPNETQQDTSSEASVKNIRMANMGLANVTQYGSKVAEITEWYTNIYQDDVDEKVQVPVVLTVANDTYLLRVKKLEEVGLPRAPFASYGIYPRGITFWCPSVADVYRDPNLAMNVALNQIIDNNTYRNFGMMFVSSSSGLKQSSLVPRPLGITPVTVGPNENVKDKVWQFTPPEINSAQATMQAINQFADTAAGLTAGGTVPNKGKISVTQQATMQAQIDMKTNAIRQNATLACEELYQLYADCIKMNLTVPRDVKIFGYKELTIEGVTKKNFRDVELIATATPAETTAENKAIKQKARLSMYELFKDDPRVPGQLALRRDLAKQFDISPTIVESFFQQEEQPAQPAGQPGGGPAPAGAPPGGPAGAAIPANPSNPQLSQTGAAAQAAVPPAIR